MRLLPSRAQIGGRIVIDGRDVLRLKASRLADIRGPVVSMIFQEPGVAFDPVYSIGEQIVEMVVRHERCGRDAARKRALDLLEMVQIPSAGRRQIGGAHVRTPVTNAQLVCRLLLEKKKDDVNN